MIDKVLDYLQKELVKYLADQKVGEVSNNFEPRVLFPTEEPADSVKLPSNCIVPLLIRIEEEKTFRFDDRYLRSKSEIGFSSAPPAVPLHLYILFIARFSNYLEGMKYLSHVIRFFQARPALSNWLPNNDVPDLLTELHTPSITVQNEIWGALKTPQHPAVMYKITMLMLEEEAAASEGKVAQQVEITYQAPLDLEKARKALK